MNHDRADATLLHGFVDAIRDNPPAGQVTARLRHRWQGGFAVDGETERTSQAGEVVTGAHTFRTDWPPPFGTGSGPTPGAESVLAAVGACVATTWVTKAALQGITIDELEVTTDGRIDLRGLFELDDTVTPRSPR